MGIGLFLDSEALGVTAGTPRPCLSSPGSNVGFFWSSKVQEIGEGKVEEQMVSEGHICDILAKMDNGKGRG